LEDVFLDDGCGINIITKQLKLRLGLPKPKPIPYSLRMVNQTSTKPMGLIHDLKIYVQDKCYIIVFIVVHNNVIDANYSMLLGKSWLRDVKITHDWGTT
jgi:hypothetical protein